MEITSSIEQGKTGYEVEWVLSDKKACQASEEQYWDLLEYTSAVYDSLDEAKNMLVINVANNSPVDWGVINEVVYEWIDGIPYGWSNVNENGRPLLYVEELM